MDRHSTAAVNTSSRTPGGDEAARTIVERVRETLRRYRMLNGGETVIVAASGGPDSTALVYLLAELRDDLLLTIHLAHLNHGLRPDAVEDAAFVAAMSRALRLGCHAASADPRALADREGLSLEDAGRRLRYEFFARVARETGAAALATGHTSDDQAETVLMRMLRGTGPEGLGGIPPVRTAGGVRIIRPLIDTPRHDVEGYLRSRGIGWREDSTNQDPTILRNRIRRVLIPVLEGYNPDVRQALVRLAGLLRDEVGALESLAAPEIARALSGRRGAVIVAREPFRRLPVALQRRAIREAVRRVRGNLHAVGFVHLEGARRLVLEGRAGSRVVLPGGVRVARLPGGAEVAMDDPVANPAEYRVPVPGRVVAIEFGLHLRATEVAGDGLVEVRMGRPQSDEIVLDGAAIGSELILRGPRPGDRFAPAGMHGRTKTIADYLGEAKVPRHRRAFVPVLTTEGGEILWIIGMRASERAQVTEATTRAVRVAARPLLA
ncbi:MAG TPA: tRNA lysidine(34) synthetase TilS [bacterium]|nr:tRNA lysidine(34) synthetase TilS [bacterium]